MRNKKGLTLVEVVVAMGLFGVIMVTLFPAFLITNLMNITSREFTDANFEAQSELEEIYDLSKSLGVTAASVLDGMGYDTPPSTVCTTSPCERLSGVYRYVVTFGPYNDPVTGPSTTLTNVIISVSKIVDNPQIGEDRAQLQIVLRFGESFTP